MSCLFMKKINKCIGFFFILIELATNYRTENYCYFLSSFTVLSNHMHSQKEEFDAFDSVVDTYNIYIRYLLK